ncbi:ABC transporter permease [Sporolactobacillus sp. THM7-7]|nr:ABC transporter permease [Sporolactobacillus sp. THM7-7]
MKLRTMNRHLRESFRSLTRNGWMSFASISAVTVSLVLVAMFLIVMFNLNKIAGDVENDVEVKVYLDQSTTAAQQNQLEERLKGIADVQSVSFVSRKEGLNSLLDSLGTDSNQFQDLQRENPLPNAFVLKTNQPEQTIQVASEARNLPNVADVRYGKGTVERLFKFVNIMRNVGIVLILGLLFTSVFLIANTIKLTIVARRREIEIMKLCGATNAFVRWPYFIEGLLMGILGSLIPVTLVIVVYHFAYYNLSSNLSQMFIRLIPFQTMVTNLSLLLVGIGALIGVWGSVSSVRKFLKI